LVLFDKEDKDNKDRGPEYNPWVIPGEKEGGILIAKPPRSVPGKFRVPGRDPVEFFVQDMAADWHQFPDFALYPLRSLLPPENLSRFIGK